MDKRAEHSSRPSRLGPSRGLRRGASCGSRADQASRRMRRLESRMACAVPTCCSAYLAAVASAVASVAMEQPRRSRRCAAWPERAPTREAGHGCRRQRRHKSVAFEKLENLSHLNVAQAQQEGAVSAVAFASNHKKSRLHIDER